MENKIYNDDVERIVNEPKRQAVIVDRYYKRMTKRQRKRLIDTVAYAAIALSFGLMGCVGWMNPYIAFLVCGIGGLYSAFRFGRWFENGKCWGWK